MIAKLAISLHISSSLESPVSNTTSTIDAVA